MSRLGVAITTRNRPLFYQKTYDNIVDRLPNDAILVVVDDASDPPVKTATYWFTQNVGIAKAKNKCIELLANRGCEHMFLFDDDVYPLVDGWAEPYVESSEPHLMLCWKDAPRSPAEIVHEYRDTFAFSRPRGAMLYLDSSILNEVGGLNPNFGKWGYEHLDWSWRIHNLGFTRAPFQDVKGSEKLFFAHDRDNPENKDSVVSRENQRKWLREYRRLFDNSHRQAKTYDWRLTHD